MRSTGLIMQQPPPNPWSQRVQHAFSATSARAGKGRSGRQKGVKCMPFQVTGGHWRTLENVSWPGAIALICIDAQPRGGFDSPQLHTVMSRDIGKDPNPHQGSGFCFRIREGHAAVSWLTASYGWDGPSRVMLVNNSSSCAKCKRRIASRE